MAVHPVLCTMPAPIKGIDADAENIPVSWGTVASGASANRGYLVATTADSRVAGKLIVAEKADTGKDPALGTWEYMGILRFDIADTVALTAADINKGIKGAANGAIALVAYESDDDADLAAASKYDADLQGRVVDYSNTTGNKWVDVLLPAQ